MEQKPEIFVDLFERSELIYNLETFPPPRFDIMSATTNYFRAAKTIRFSRKLTTLKTQLTISQLTYHLPFAVKPGKVFYNGEIIGTVRLPSVRKPGLPLQLCKTERFSW